jgi:hypothetical protein
MEKHFKPFARFTLISWLLIIILAILALASCSAPKRLERLEKNHPYLFDKITDTVKFYDTIRFRMPSSKLDTVFKLPGYGIDKKRTSNKKDTVYFENARLSARLIFEGDSIHFTGVAKEIDSLVPYYVEIPVKRFVPYRRPRDGLTWKGYLMIIISFIVLSLVIIIFFRTRNKKEQGKDV